MQLRRFLLGLPGTQSSTVKEFSTQTIRGVCLLALTNWQRPLCHTFHLSVQLARKTTQPGQATVISLWVWVALASLGMALTWPIADPFPRTLPQ